jgi:hypothetical protein
LGTNKPLKYLFNIDFFHIVTSCRYFPHLFYGEAYFIMSHINFMNFIRTYFLLASFPFFVVPFS